MEIKIRHANKNDTFDIIEIKRHGWLSAYTHIFGEDKINHHFDSKKNDPEYIKTSIEQIETNPHSYVATIDDKAVATMAIKEILPEEDFIEVLYLYVHPAYQRHGIGKKLYDIAISVAKENNKNNIHIEAIKDNYIGCAFYRKNGGKDLSTRTRTCCGIEVDMITFNFDI